MTNYYQILDLKVNATKEEIKRAFRERALLFHPDKNHSPDASEIFQQIFEAYEVLSDENKRKIYDGFFFHSEELTGRDTYKGQDEWKETSKRKAEEYSKMKYSEFQESGLFKDIEFMVKNTPTVLAIVGMVFMVICVGVLISMLGNVNGDPGVILFAFILFAGIGISLFVIAKHDFENLNRKRKIYKKHENK